MLEVDYTFSILQVILAHVTIDKIFANSCAIATKLTLYYFSKDRLFCNPSSRMGDFLRGN